MLEQSRSPVTLLCRKQVESRTGLSKSTIYKLASEGNFPKPIKLGDKAVAWIDHQVDHWIAMKIGDAAAQ
jgi:prophage regulatory protein